MEDEKNSAKISEAEETSPRTTLWHKCKVFLIALTNPRFLLCFGIAWMITNGWAYILLGVGAFYEVRWMLAVGGAYLAFLWLPVTPEKLITIPIAIFFLRWLFPKDEKTLLLIRRIGSDAKKKVQDAKEKHKERMEEKNKEDDSEGK